MLLQSCCSGSERLSCWVTFCPPGPEVLQTQMKQNWLILDCTERAVEPGELTGMCKWNMHTMRKKHFPNRDKHFFYAMPQTVQLQSVIARTCFKLFHYCQKYFFKIKKSGLLTPAYADTRVHINHILIYIYISTLRPYKLTPWAMSDTSAVPITQSTCPAAPSLALPLHKAKRGA